MRLLQDKAVLTRDGRTFSSDNLIAEDFLRGKGLAGFSHDAIDRASNSPPTFLID